jgi:transaldolase
MKPKTEGEGRIAQELQQMRAFSLHDIVHMIEQRQPEEAADHLVFYSVPKEFPAQLQTLRDQLAARLAQESSAFQQDSISFLSHVTLDLSSSMVHWNLQRAEVGCDALTVAKIQAEVDANLDVLREWERLAPAAAHELLTAWRDSATARFRAEKGAQPDLLADRLVGNSVVAYLRNMASAVAKSHLRRVSEMRVAGLNHTELGNDYASFLKYTMYLGASFVTTNPVLVNVAWVDDPAHWNPVMQALVDANPQSSEEELARLATLEVVLANMHLLRPIFLLTQGTMGSVSLQVNPKKHGDAESMVADAKSLYDELQARLNGGVPNVVFKLPATLGGLRACRVLTGQGIGVNITINFGLFQLLRFAEAIRGGNAVYCCLSEMNGRLAFPVRDELLAKLPALAEQGITEADAREAAAWSGVLVVKKLHQLMDEQGYDLQRIKPLVASLRIYKEGPGYDRLPSAYPDVTETIGTRIITVFPNVRHAFDNEPQMDLRPVEVNAVVPPRVLEVLAHSEMFKQAYYVSDRGWAHADDERLRPDKVLALEDEAAVAAWTPVHNTLKEFAESYDRFVARLVSLRS